MFVAVVPEVAFASIVGVMFVVDVLSVYPH